MTCVFLSKSPVRSKLRLFKSSSPFLSRHSTYPTSRPLFLPYRRSLHPKLSTMAPIPPKSMSAVQIPHTGDSSVLQYHSSGIPIPQPSTDEALIQNSHIGINYIDTYFRTGLYPTPPEDFPLILGKEGAGTIVSEPSASSTTSFKKGDRVAYMAPTGTYASHTAAPMKYITKIPDSISNEVACAALLQGLTALTLVTQAHEVKPGDWVLVTAASGGVGGLLCQILKSKGAKTIASVGSLAKVQIAKDAGAELVCVEGEDDIPQIVKSATNGEGVRVSFDGVGRSTFSRNLELVARKGSIISFGNASGAVEPFKISELSKKNHRIMRPTLFNFLATREEFEEEVARLWDLVEQGELKVKIHDIYKLEDVKRAHDDLEGRRTMGKLLMTP